MNANLKTIEVCVEFVLTLDVCDQTHGQLFIILVPDVHQGSDIQRQAIYTWWIQYTHEKTIKSAGVCMYAEWT